MWLFSKIIHRALFATSLLVGAMVLAACSFAPLYGENSRSNPRFELAYAEPNSRLEQIVYQDLRLKLGETQQLDAPLLSISVSKSSRRVGRSSNGTPSVIYEIILSGSVSLVRAGAGGNDNPETIFSSKRVASASYTTNGQVLNDRQAEQDASERAAHQLSEVIRLTLIGALATTPTQQ